MNSPTVLLIEDQEWTARSIESILRPASFAVFKTYTGQQGLEVALKVDPDLILVDLHLPDMSGKDLIGRLKDLPSVSPVTPIAVITSGPVTQAERLALLRAGAWDIFTSPFDPDELSARVDTWARAKKEADRAREASLVDQLTGSYNFEGLTRRVREIVAEARRYERPLTCIVLGEPMDTGGSTLEEGAGNGADLQVVQSLLEVCRISDVVGRIRNSEFMVVAPSTDESGAAVLAQRILAALKDRVSESDIRAGVFSLKRSRKEPLDFTDLLEPATAALRRAQSEKERFSFHTIDPN